MFGAVLILASAVAEPPAPRWANGSTTYQYAGKSQVVGGLADRDRFGYGSGANIEASYVGIDTPADTRAINSTSIAGYSRCNGGKTQDYVNCVGVLGVGILGADSRAPDGTSGGAWGVNALAVNGAGAQAKDRTGFDFGFLGNELDVNVIARSDGTPPLGNAIGAFVVGASEVQPRGHFDAIQISAARAPWKNGLFVDSGTADVAIQVGAATRAGNSGSMPIQLFGRDGPMSNQIASISADEHGNLMIAPAPSAGRGIVQINGSLRTPAAFKVADLPVCNNATALTRVFVSDAAKPTYAIGAPVSGGGNQVIPAYCDGRMWRAG